ncbi:BACON domain-containing protein [Leyella stercorea]|uniref:BACON domain-containing protein n=1 Tax=Leyella stercorea TaxID=363265 RepID=UPI0025893C70|nr:BACON domain-containing protein [Leyella stercorea]
MTKFFNNYLFLLCVAFGALFFSSCSKDDDAENDNGGVVINPDKNLPDPTGTVTLNIMIGDDENKRVDINGFGTIQINSAYNFVGYDYNYSFVSLGKMKGLGNVTAIPQDGWNRSVAVNPGDGYVVRCKRYYSDELYIYARLYVVSEIAGTSGGIIGYTIKCQAPFVFAPKFTESSLEFDADENLTKELTFVNPTNVTVKSKPDWCEVQATEKGFKVTATPNYINTERSGIIEFENAEGSTSVSVKQKKSDNPKFEAGNGTETEPYIIATAAQLDEVRNFPSACFELSKDIDLSSYLNSNSSGWTPIKDFTGKFDGKKHTIKGLWISLSSINYVGLFANIQSSSGNKRASVSNLFVNISKKGITGGSRVGGICGSLSNGNIENCMVTGDISGYQYVGGIVGVGGEWNNDISSISQCASSGNIIATDGKVGGILGYRYGLCSIENCYSIANVKAEGSYSSSVYGIGYSAENCYFAGTISDTGDVYPIGVYNTNSYYDSEKTKISWKEGALTTKQMKQQASFQGWDFDKIWTIQEGVDYPKLRSLQK